MQAVFDTNVLVSALFWHGPPPLTRPVCRDPDDDAVLALALAANVDCIVSGDDDLLVLQTFEGIAIITPAQALLRIGTG